MWILVRSSCTWIAVDHRVACELREVHGLAGGHGQGDPTFLRYAAADDAGNPNPVALDTRTVGMRRAYGFGSSSTGMYLREFLYLGFNEDEAHRQVFDAIRIAIPGTHRLFANVAFADPNVYSRQDQHADFLSSSYPPLSYVVTTDPITGGA